MAELPDAKKLSYTINNDSEPNKIQAPISEIKNQLQGNHYNSAKRIKQRQAVKLDIQV
jgi:hypothetical protein